MTLLLEDGTRVPAAPPPLWLGRAMQADVVFSDLRVSVRHARLDYARGAWMLTAVDGATVAVNGSRVPFFPLRSGDVVELGGQGGEAGVRLVFENRMEDVFVPEGGPWASAWCRHPGVADPRHGPRRLVPDFEGPLAAGQGTRRLPGTEVALQVVGPLQTPEDCEGHLCLVRALTGARHPALARVLDGGLTASGGAPLGWVAWRWAEGETLDAVLARGDVLPAGAVATVLADLAEALFHLHGRRVLHRDVAPGNVVLSPEGRATLIDFSHAAVGERAAASPGVRGTPGYVAPEEVLSGGEAVGPRADVYGAGAVGYALLTGRPPAQAEDLLETLARARRRPVKPRDLGVEVPPALESALLEALEPDPALRADAERLLCALRFATASIRLGGAT